MGPAVRRTRPQSRITAAPVEDPNYGGPKVGIAGAVRSTSRSKPGCWERNFWMQRQGAKNHHEKGRAPAETKVREVSGRKSPQKRPFWRRLGKGGLRRLDGGGSRAQTEDPPPGDGGGL